MTDMTDTGTETASVDSLEQLVDELRATVEMKDHLLQMVSHEMRTPLVSITNFSSTILESWDVLADEHKREYLGIVNSQAVRLSRLVNDLLAVARLEAGRLRTVREEVALREVATETIGELSIAADDVEVACAPDATVVADRDHVKQILVNYLSNASKYGEAPYRIDCEQVDGATRLFVEDSGSGVDDELRPNLFEKFAQGRDAGPQTGSGLGLSIVQGLAHAQQGDAWYEAPDASAGTGPRFGVTIPKR